MSGDPPVLGKGLLSIGCLPLSTVIYTFYCPTVQTGKLCIDCLMTLFILVMDRTLYAHGVFDKVCLLSGDQVRMKIHFAPYLGSEEDFTG